MPWKVFVPPASEIWTKSYGPNTKFLAFWQKKKKKKQVFQNQFWQSVDTILEDVSVAEIIV